MSLLLTLFTCFTTNICNKMKSKKYHFVGTVQKSNRKIDENANSISLTYKYMTAHFPGLEQALIKISFIQINNMR